MRMQIPTISGIYQLSQPIFSIAPAGQTVHVSLVRRPYCDEKTLVIKIGDLTHLSLRWDDGQLNFQSWIQNVSVLSTMKLYCIEYYVGGETVLTEYESQDMWRDILQQLERVLA